MDRKKKRNTTMTQRINDHKMMVSLINSDEAYMGGLIIDFISHMRQLDKDIDLFHINVSFVSGASLYTEVPDNMIPKLDNMVRLIRNGKIPQRLQPVMIEAYNKLLDEYGDAMPPVEDYKDICIAGFEAMGHTYETFKQSDFKVH